MQSIRILKRTTRKMHLPNFMHLSIIGSGILSLRIKCQQLLWAFYIHFLKCRYCMPLTCKISFTYPYNFCYSVFALHRIHLIFFFFKVQHLTQILELQHAKEEKMPCFYNVRSSFFGGNIIRSEWREL